jgi:hypothetical protein
MNERKNLTPAQERRAIELFNSFLNNDDHYLKMVLLFSKMTKQYLLSYHCEGLSTEGVENTHVLLDNFGFLLDVPTFDVEE